MQKILLITLCCFQAMLAVGQQVYEKSFTSNFRPFMPVKMCRVGEQSYAFCGTRSHLTEASWDFTLTKMNVDGTVVFAKEYSEYSNIVFWDEATNILHLADGGYLITYFSDSTGAANYYPSAIRLDEQGEVVWNKSFNTSQQSRFFASFECENGDLIFGGHQEGVLGDDCIVLRTNQMGDTLWSRKLWVPGYGMEVIRDIQETKDHDIVALGNSPLGAGGIAACVAKFTADGDTLWAKTYGISSGSIDGYSIKELADGSFYIAGYVVSSNSNYGGFVAKIDANGQLLHTSVLGMDKNVVIFDLEILQSGDLVICGSLRETGASLDGFVALTDSLGSCKKAVTYSNWQWEEMRDLFLVGQNQCVAIGVSNSNAYSQPLPLIAKENPTMLNACDGLELIFQDTTLTIEVASGFTLSGNPLTTTLRTYVAFDIPMIDSLECTEFLEAGMEKVNDSDAYLYPNPASNKLFLGEPVSLSSSIEVYNSIGEKVKVAVSDGNFMDVSELEKGLYFVVFELQGERRSFLFVKE